VRTSVITPTTVAVNHGARRSDLARGELDVLHGLFAGVGDGLDVGEIDGSGAAHADDDPSDLIR
jgi:hypothetical protein